MQERRVIAWLLLPVLSSAIGVCAWLFLQWLSESYCECDDQALPCDRCDPPPPGGFTVCLNFGHAWVTEGPVRECRRPGCGASEVISHPGGGVDA